MMCRCCTGNKKMIKSVYLTATIGITLHTPNRATNLLTLSDISSCMAVSRCVTRKTDKSFV